MTEISRRRFVQISALASGGVLLGFDLGAVAEGAADGPFQPSAWLRIEANGRLVFILDKAEMGQGVNTALPTILAEELEVDPAALVVEHAPADPRYGNPALAGLQATGGSTSVATSYEPLRRAGATARTLLVAAAAQEWGVPASECLARDGAVHHDASRRTATYGALAKRAAAIPAPKSVLLKEPSAFRQIGKPRRRLDAPDKVRGVAAFGIDVAVPDARVAVLVQCPTFGGTLRKLDAAAAKAVPGVEDVAPVAGGVAVVARRYWQARKAADLLQIEWSPGALATLSTDAAFRGFEELARAGLRELVEHADARGRLSMPRGLVQAEYRVPYMAHAAMEPVNCTARVTAELCEVWAPTQAAGIAAQAAAEASGLPRDRVRIHTTLMGGGFGRRLYQDFVAQAVAISKAVGKPVKLVWSRAEDMQHDFYRPGTAHALRATLDADGTPMAWAQCVAGPSILATTLPQWMKAMMPAWMPGGISSATASLAGGIMKAVGADGTATEGADSMPYALDVALVSYKRSDPGIPVGFWRSVGHSYTGFVVESFLDELAHAAKQDPLAYRRRLLTAKPRHLAVLDLAAQKAGWGQPLPAGLHRGLALHESFGSICAQVAEVRVDRASGAIKVERIVAAIDCGRVINPAHVEAQLMGGVLFGLSATLYGEITVKDGAVEQSNFHDFPVARMPDAPRVEVHVVPSEASPSGIGEPGVPPVAAAVGNAVFAATGQRLRSLPLRLATS